MNYKRACFIVLFVSIFSLNGCNRYPKGQYQGYIEGKLNYMASETSGRLVKMDVKRGMIVKKGQSLFTLELNPQLSAYRQAIAEFKRAQAQLANLEKGKRPSELAMIVAQEKQIRAQIKYAKITVLRYQKLYAKHFVTKDKLDDAVTKLNVFKNQLEETHENLITAKLAARIDQIKAAKDQVKSAKAQLAQYRWTLNQKVIQAPLPGTVFDCYYRVGEAIPKNNPVVSILNPENIHVLFYAPEKILSTLRLGEKITFTCDGCKKPATAKISFISPQAEYTPPVIYSETTRAKLIYRIEAKMPYNVAQKFHPGQPITVFVK